MCEEKPGPRCSSDALKNIRSMQAAVKLQKKSVKEAADAVIAARETENADRWAGKEQEYKHTSQLAELEHAKDALQSAYRAYDATPEGIKAVEKSLSEAGDTVISKQLIKFDEFGVPVSNPSEAKPIFGVSKKVLLTNRLAVAKEHREWQSKTLRGLKKAESEKLSKALFVSRELEKSLRNESNALFTQNMKTREEYNKLSEGFNEEGFIEKNKAAISKNLVEQDIQDNRREYLMMRMEDMKAYHKKVAQKIMDKPRTYVKGKYLPK